MATSPMEQIAPTILETIHGYSSALSHCETLAEAAEKAYGSITAIVPIDLLIIQGKVKGEDANLLFIRTVNDSTITGSIMKKEREISQQMINGEMPCFETVLSSTPPLHYFGTVCASGGNFCTLSMMRSKSEFPEDHKLFVHIILQLFLSAFQASIIEEKSRKLGTQEVHTRQQNDFISSITHDLRNPLGCIKGYSSTLLRDDIQWDAETQRKFIEVIDNEADRLGDMISNILETGRLESGVYELSFDQVAVSTIINTLLETNTHRHPGIKIHVETHPNDSLIMVDTQKIIRAFQNLIDNTVKHTNTLEIWIKIQTDRNLLHFYFTDEGEGIPHTRWKSIFNKFSRIPNDSPGTHGTGLGLYITKQIILKHGGTIEVDEAAQEGTSIHIVLPKIPSSGKTV